LKPEVKNDDVFTNIVPCFTKIVPNPAPVRTEGRKYLRYSGKVSKKIRKLNAGIRNWDGAVDLKNISKTMSL
jgi:hypothetical protein